MRLDFESARIGGKVAIIVIKSIDAAFVRNRFIPGIYVVAGLSFGFLFQPEDG